MTSRPSSEIVYTNSLLNELHHVFPAFLYDQDRFENVHDVFAYVRERARYFGDTFSRSAEQYRASSSSYTTEPPYIAPRRATAPMNRGRQSATRVPGLRRPTQDEIRMTVDLHEMPGGDLASLNSVVSSLFGPILGLDESLLRNRVDLSRFFDESVPVQAPPMIIEAVSEIKTIEEPAGPCAICQEETRMGDVLRQFRAPCNHSFHRSCIDPWLERNVHCPVCRRDIRELPVV